MPFPLLNKPKAAEYAGMNNAQKRNVIDIYAEPSKKKKWKKMKELANLGNGDFVPERIIKKYFKLIRNITRFCKSQMLDKEIEINSIDDLKILVNNQYESYPSQLTSYVIDKLIEFSTIEKTFKAYKSSHDNLTQI